jgi:uncharacterized protein YbjQ (UPF0145 family)
MTERRPFTSALGTREAFAVAHAGLVPLRQVMGVSYFKMGWQNMSWAAGGGLTMRGAGGTFELENQTEAWNEARRLAVQRLRDEAVACGADLVVGVRAERRRRDWSRDLVEFVVTGTAVRATRHDVGGDAPLMCNLPGQDVAKLIAHGFWPVGIAGGSTVAYVASGYNQAARSGGLFSGRYNQELPDFSQGMYDARALAMERVERDAHRLGATGVVGVTIDRSQRSIERDVNNVSYTDLVIELHVIGTAIAETAGASATPPPPKHITLPLS